MNRALQVIVLTTLGIAWQGAPPVAALEAGQRLEVQVIGMSTAHSQGKHGATAGTSGTGTDLGEGELARSYMAYGWLDEKTGYSLKQLCASANGTIPAGMDPAVKRSEIFATQRAAHFWSVDYRVLPSKPGKVALNLTWEHWSAVGTGKPMKVGGDTRRIEMREGERHVFDYVSFTPSGDDYCASNVQIAITANILEDPDFANESLAYDVWFEHRDARGIATRRHAESVGRQGESVAIRAEPMRFPVPGAAFTDGVRADAVVELTGDVLARLQRDGSVTVELRAGRWIGVARADGPRGGGIGDGGNQIFNLKLGETVRLTLPAPGSASRSGIDRRMSPRGNVPGKVDPAATIWLHHSKLYEGSEDSILLTVSRVR